MPPPLNLNRYRKARARSEAEAQAAANRVAYGRTNAEKAAQTKTQTKAAREHAGRRLDREAPPLADQALLSSKAEPVRGSDNIPGQD